ncbi:MAG: hypothetical protein HYS56_04165, partial [Candidatus Omnitrophica bacterium]|nr:hypothetical protein [Candidatus Omnitrophota bacterium]
MISNPSLGRYALVGIVFPLVLNLFIPETAAETLSTSVAGIVSPSSRAEQIKIYRTPRVLESRSAIGVASISGTISISSEDVPGSAVGVFLYVEAVTDLYFGLSNSERLSSPPPNPPVPASTISGNFLQIGARLGGYAAPLDRVYHENNVFYLPLTKEVSHTINWEVLRSDLSKPASFKVVCLG